MTSVLSALRLRGLTSATEFLSSNTGVPYAVAAGRLGDVAPIALIVQARNESRRDGTEDWFLRDCLVREILEVCVDGWRTGDTGDFDAADALGSWIALVEPLGQPWIALARSAAHALLHSEVAPSGWRPLDLEDAVIDQALRTATCEPTR